MIEAVLDTSVAVAWYLQESFSPEAREWQKRLLDGRARLLVPSLHYSEFGNVLRTYVRRKLISADTALELYALHLEAPLEVVEPSPAGLLECALEYDVTTYDAMYIRLSLDQQAALITAERSTTPWVKKLGELAIRLGRRAS